MESGKHLSAQSEQVDASGDRRFLDFRRDTLDASGNVAFLVDSDRVIAYCNPAWDRFALANNGEHAAAKFVLGRRIDDFIPTAMRRFYDDVFSIAKTPRIVRFDYECSSPDLYRCFRMEVMFLRSYGGFLISNSLRLEKAHREVGNVAFPPDRFRYEGADGLIVMCCNCRKTRRLGEWGTWDWVPAHLQRAAGTVSHGICPICSAHLYPELVATTSI